MFIHGKHVTKNNSEISGIGWGKSRGAVDLDVIITDFMVLMFGSYKDEKDEKDERFFLPHPYQFASHTCLHNSGTDYYYDFVLPSFAAQNYRVLY